MKKFFAVFLIALMLLEILAGCSLNPTTTTAPTTTEEGCASVIGGSVALILAIACGAACVIRKKED